MTRRQLLEGLGAAAAARAANGRRPNFLFLFTDDQRFDTIGALGHPEVRTPTMDRLVSRGVTFTHTFTMGGTAPAICVPSRAMLMTGRSLFRVHDSVMAPASAPESERRPFVTFPEVLRRAGYVTFGTGKWHNGPALYARSFSNGGEIFFGGMSDQRKVAVNDFDPSGFYPKQNQRIGASFSSQMFSDAAIRFLKERPRGTPFLLYVAYTSPHDPRMAPQRYADLYVPERMRLPENFLPQHPFDNGELRVRDELLAPFPRTPEEVRRHIAGYYAMISEVDAQMGRVLEALEQSGEAANTYVIFAADNGLAVGQHGLMGKQNLYDHSVRVPLVISGPGIRKNRRAGALCHLMDVCPTILELAGVPIPTEVEARSLQPLLDNPRASFRDAVMFAYRNLQRGIRTDRWKLIVYNVGGQRTTQLFDLARDPHEKNNLAGDPAHAGRRRELQALLRRMMKEAGDRVDLEAARWTAYS